MFLCLSVASSSLDNQLTMPQLSTVLEELLSTLRSILRLLKHYRFCTECLGEGPHTCGPHLQASEASLTPEDVALLQLPGVRPRVPLPQPPWLAAVYDKIEMMHSVLMTVVVILILCITVIGILIGCILYLSVNVI